LDLDDAEQLGVSREARGSISIEPSRILEIFMHMPLNPEKELPSEVLLQALTAIGYYGPVDKIVQSILLGSFSGRSFLDATEFEQFVRIYDIHHWRHVAEMFKDADENSVGYLGAAEVSTLLRRADITPMPGVAAALIFELTGVPNGAGRICLKNYVKLLDMFRDRAGFTLAEVAKYKCIFRRYDRNREGTIDAAEAEAVFSWLGLAADNPSTAQQEVAALVQQVGTASPGRLCEADFIQLMRRFREQDIVKVRAAFSQVDHQHHGHINVNKLQGLFHALGSVTVSTLVAQEAVSDCQLSADAELRFEEVYSVVERVREKDGFLNRELEDIAQIFDKFNAEPWDCGGIRLQVALRWLGYCSSLVEVQEDLDDFEVDGAGAIRLLEFRKLVARQRDAHILQVHEVFQEESATRIPVAELCGLLVPAAREHLDAFIARLDAYDQVDVWKFVELSSEFRTEACERLRANQGFDDDEMQRYRKQFAKHDRKDTGFLSKKPLANLVEELFPNVRRCFAEHAVAKVLLDQVDTDRNGELDFQEFLSLMHLIHERGRGTRIEKETLKKQKENKIIEITKFSRFEVKEFRKVFHQFDTDSSGDMSCKEFEELLSQVVPTKGNKITADIKALISDVDEDGDHVLDFAEFLHVMWKILDGNWHQVNEAASVAAVASREAPEAPSSAVA